MENLNCVVLLVVVCVRYFGVKIVVNTISKVSNSHCMIHVNLVVPFGEIVANHVVDLECNLPIVVSLLPLLIVVLGGGEP